MSYQTMQDDASSTSWTGTMLRRLLICGFGVSGLGIEVVKTLLGLTSSFGTLTLTASSGRVQVTWSKGGFRTPTCESECGTSSSACQVASALLSDVPANRQRLPGTNEWDEDPYSYIVPEKVLLDLFHRVQQGEDPDMVLAEMWIKYEWAETTLEGDIIDNREEDEDA